MEDRQVVANRFELSYLIGEGGVGRVYKGLDTRSGEPVAITAVCQFVAPGAKVDRLAWQSHLPDLAQRLSLPEADLRAAVGSVHAIEEGQLLRVPRLLQRVVDTFSEIGRERLDLLDRLDKIAEMSRI